MSDRTGKRRRPRSTAARALLVAGAVAGAGYVGLRALAAADHRRPDPYAGEDFAEPVGLLHHRVPTHDGGLLHVVERGQGRPIVLLHGLTLSWRTWHYQLLDLADRFRVVAIDQRGHGESTVGSDGFGLDRLAKDLASVLDHLDLDRAVLVGHSMGGMSVMHFCAGHPEVLGKRVAGLVFVSTAAAQVVTAPAVLLSRVVTPGIRGGSRLLSKLPRGPLRESDASYAVVRLGLGRSPSPTHVDFTRAMVASTPLDVAAESMVPILGHDVEADLRALDVPALVVVGTRDLLTPVRQAKRIARAIRGSRLVVLDGAGHMPMLERRREVSALLAEFASSLP